MSKGNSFCKALYKLRGKTKQLFHKAFTQPMTKRSFAQCGSCVNISRNCSFSGIENVYVGKHVSLGGGTKILTTRAKLIIGNYVMFGPGVTVVTGNHRTDILGRYMSTIKDSEKLAEDDQDVIIEDDVWVGANATILKGVTIGKGSIVAAGAVVTQSCPPYSIIGGVPAKVIKPRFTPTEIEEHERLLADFKEQKK